MTDDPNDRTDPPAEPGLPAEPEVGTPADPGPADPRANPFDAWLAEAPTASAASLCPWCSATLGGAPSTTCPSCGAHLRGEDSGEIPGLTVVDPEVVVRRGPARKPSGSVGVIAWLSGDSDLVDAASAERPRAAGAAPAADAMPQADAAAVLGAPGRDAVAPPDARVRREMWRLAAGVPDDGSDADDATGQDAAAGPDDAAGPSDEVSTAGDAAAPDGDADPGAAPSAGRPAAD